MKGRAQAAVVRRSINTSPGAAEGRMLAFSGFARV
jgi:hypothetical protein